MSSGPLKSVAGLVCLFVLSTAGCSAPAGRSDQDGQASATPVTTYAPYVDATTAASQDTAGSPTTYNLAFVLASGEGCAPAWHGARSVDDASVVSRVSELTESGADVRVSFGGAAGTELASVCDSAEELAEAYGTALDAVGATRADFDIEGDELTDSGSVALRSEAVALLQEEYAELDVSFTVPVMPSGLDQDVLDLLASANHHNVRVRTVNLMTMNYGESYDGDMGDYAVASAEAANTQLMEVFGWSGTDAWRGMALTSMIGVNDVEGETFSLADAAQVRAFAEEKGIAWVSMWSSFRDQRCAQDSGAGDPATDCSGVTQEAGAFAKTFTG